MTTYSRSIFTLVGTGNLVCEASDLGPEWGRGGVPIELYVGNVRYRFVEMEVDDDNDVVKWTYRAAGGLEVFVFND